MQIEHLLAWRAAREWEKARLEADPRLATDPALQRRLQWIEFELELLEQRIRETAGAEE